MSDAAENLTAPDTTSPTSSDVYRVLARKYRPQNFSELKGQDALVRTLTNAIESGRVAHAFMLTGVRGVGKTTTARIIARALNCVGADGKGRATPTPCGVCEHCVAISEDRHVDVLEMDAASRTGVDDIRDIIDSVRYSASSARYKVYIIDEVHMLSKQAFNALLKTLEEPPDHVKFVFATTEIRKVPVTVLSRCQRFDLKRIDANILASYFTEILNKENVSAETEAINLIARAADGSARDGLSLLDRAISLEGERITEAQVRDMLGVADRTVILDLLDHALKGQAEGALQLLDTLHKAGADPLVILQDMLAFTHFLTKARAVPALAGDLALPEAERTRGAALAAALSMPVLTRTWQILLKGITEVQHAPQPEHAAEIVLLRLIYAADIPAPGDLVKQIVKDSRTASAAASPEQAVQATPPTGGNTALAVQTQPHPERCARPTTFREAVALFGEKREAVLYGHLYNNVIPVKFERGRIEFDVTDDAPPQLPSKVAALLSEWTGERWIVSVSTANRGMSLGDEDRIQQDQLRAQVESHPDVQKVITAFPGAKIINIQERT